MKQLFKRFERNFALLSLATILLAVSFACSKKNDPSGDNQDAQLQVSVRGLEDYVLEEVPIDLSAKVNDASRRAYATYAARAATAPNVGTSFSKFADDGKEHEVYVSDDFDVDFEYEKMHPKPATTADQPNNAGLSMSTARSLVARQPIGTNIKYRLLIYRQGETVPVINVEGSGTSFPATAIASGFNYRWIAVSTNETGSSPTVTNNQIAGSQIANKDFLFASGTLTTQFGQNYLNIVFKRYTTRILLTVDSRGMFGNIAGNSNISFTMASGDNLSETGDFSVLDSTFSNYQPVAVSSNNMTGADPAVKAGTLYTVRPRAVAAGSLRLKVNPLVLTLDDGSARTFANHTVAFGSAFAPVRGSSYAITARLIESGVRVGTSTVRWARSNLTYTATAAEGFRYRFRPHPTNYTFDINRDMWNFLATTPTGGSFTAVNPCRQVYPAQTWRLPFDNEFQELPSPNSLERYTPLILGGVGLVANWNRSSAQAANSAYPEMDQLRLPAYGYRTTANTLSNDPYLLLLLAYGQGHYYSGNYNRNSPITDPVQPATVRTHFFRMNYSGLNLIGIINILDGYSQLLITDTSSPNNSTNVWNEGRSIRCVRNL